MNYNPKGNKNRTIIKYNYFITINTPNKYKLLSILLSRKGSPWPNG